MRLAWPIAARRGVEAVFLPVHEAPAYVCDARIVGGFDRALAALGQPAFHLPSGAGHDTMVMGQMVPSGMLFVRCAGGISHNPAGVDHRRGLRTRARRADAVCGGVRPDGVVATPGTAGVPPAKVRRKPEVPGASVRAKRELHAKP